MYSAIGTALPFLLIRSLSDKADKNAQEDLDKYYKMAAKNSAVLVEKIVEDIGLKEGVRSQVVR